MNELTLAQMETPIGLAAWLASASFLLVIANQAFRLKERLLGEKSPREIFPQPLEVRPVPEPVTREFCERHDRASALRLDALEKELGELRSARRESTARLGAQIESVSREIPELERRLNVANEARFEKVHSRINEVLGEVRELRGAVNNL